MIKNKNIFLNDCLSKIIESKNKCNLYNNYLNSMNFNPNKIKKLDDLPFIHVNSFKNLDLMNIKKEKIFKVLKSSGTTSDKYSKIYLDKINAKKQQVVLSQIMSRLLAGKRKPMIICEKKPNLKNSLSYNASFAAIIGFSIFGKDHLYIENQDGSIDYKNLNNFLNKYKNEEKFIFGFTSKVYEILVKKLNEKKIFNNLSSSFILHGGGWKKLSNLNINNFSFKKKIEKKFKIKKIINYYGMIEQIGSIFLECDECGYFHETDYTKVIIRDHNLKKIDNKKGLIQLISNLPSSYPGNSILTEDYGKVIKDIKCSKAKNNQLFEIIGRVEKADVRGCSDVYL